MATTVLKQALNRMSEEDKVAKCVGGGSETRRALADGKLVPMMQKAGAVFGKK